MTQGLKEVGRSTVDQNEEVKRMETKVACLIQMITLKVQVEYLVYDLTELLQFIAPVAWREVLCTPYGVGSSCFKKQETTAMMVSGLLGCCPTRL